MRMILQESGKDCELWARTFYSRGTAILAVICFQFTHGLEASATLPRTLDFRDPGITDRLKVGGDAMSQILFCLTLLGAAAAEVQTREVPTTRLYVETTPPGAAIKLDGKPNGSAPKVFLVPPGVTKMIVEVELDGHGSNRQEVTIQGGRVTRVKFQLEPQEGNAATAFSEESKQPPKQLTVDLGGGVKLEDGPDSRGRVHDGITGFRQRCYTH